MRVLEARRHPPAKHHLHLSQAGVELALGEAAALGSATCGAVCSVLYRPYLRKHPAPPVSALAMLSSVGCLAAVTAQGGFFRSPPRLTPGGWLAVRFIGAGSGLGPYLWLWALGRATPTRVTVFLALSPVTATALGAPLLGEEPTVGVALGVGCVALGLWLAHLQGREHRARG